MRSSALPASTGASPAARCAAARATASPKSSSPACARSRPSTAIFPTGRDRSRSRTWRARRWQLRSRYPAASSTSARSGVRPCRSFAKAHRRRCPAAARQYRRHDDRAAHAGREGRRGDARRRRTGRPTDLFAHLRFLEDGRENRGFRSQQAGIPQAKFLIAGANFGCGSAREHAVWALRRVRDRMRRSRRASGRCSTAIASRTALVPVSWMRPRWPGSPHECAPGGPAALLTLDLERRELRTPGGRTVSALTIPAFRYRQLVEGLDEIDMTLQLRDAIAAFHRRSSAERPWLYGKHD